MTAPTLILRADAGHRLGSGHAMRLAALAEAAGPRTLLLVGGDAAGTVEALRRRGLAASGTGAATGSAGDLAQVVTSARERGARTVVVDGPGFTPSYVRALAAAGLTVVSVDDLGTAPVPGHVIVNPNLGAEALRDRYPAARHRLLGRPYALLRGEVRALPAAGGPVRADARRVLVTMGGSDPAGATARVLAALRGPSLEVMVVLGPGFQRDEAFERARTFAELRGHDVAIAVAPPELPALMAACDLAISAAGGTLAELGYLGRPTIAIAIAPDQVANARRHAAAGLCEGGLPLAELADDELGGLVTALLADRARRAELRALSAAVVDGDGAERVLGRLAELDRLAA